MIGSPETLKTVGSPNDSYESMVDVWKRNRAIIGGERKTKEHDGRPKIGTNLLIPFSASMDSDQYALFKAEAELPGVCAQYARILVGGLLRKQPSLTLPAAAPAEATDWILSEFGQDSSTLVSFADAALWEELQTSRCWVQVAHPKIPQDMLDSMEQADVAAIKPYPILWNAESVINWKSSVEPITGKRTLTQVIIRTYEESFERNEFHAEYIETIWVHELVENRYQIRVFKRLDPVTVEKSQGKAVQDYASATSGFELVDTIQSIMMANEPLKIIPLWPLNGDIELREPMLTPLIDREVSLYNKVSRRNHLLYGAATYTPVISSDMGEEDFDKIVDSGLGTWLLLRQGDTANILETPSAALKDYGDAIASTLEELARLGIRILAPESEQSGVALELRNAAQTAQLGTLNTKVSNTLADIIAFMINWRYHTQLKRSDVQFSLSEDFNPVPLGADWLRLATEWYEKGLIPRSSWLLILKTNDMLQPDYDDEEGKSEITADDLLMPKTPPNQTDGFTL